MRHTNSIERFTGEYSFLSNFYYTPVSFEGLIYPSLENAFQAAKLPNNEQRIAFLTSTNKGAKWLGRQAKLPKDWEARRVAVMRLLIQNKFRRGQALANKLIDTAPAVLIEGNNWGDRYWGVDGTGFNMLGRLLMEQRKKLILREV